MLLPNLKLDPTQKDPLRVNLTIFEGPLDLLLYLVKADEIDIYEIEIARITSQYLAALEAMHELSLDIAGEFLVMAAQLLYIKSRTLLPVADQLPENAEEEEDPRLELIRQLVEYKKFKEAAAKLGSMEEAQAVLFKRPESPRILVEERSLHPGVTMLDLVHALQKVLDRWEKKKKILKAHEIEAETFTVGQKMESILNQLECGQNMLFADLFTPLASRHEIVVTFLALLELIRLKQLQAVQNHSLGAIQIERAAQPTFLS